MPFVFWQTIFVFFVSFPPSPAPRQADYGAVAPGRAKSVEPASADVLKKAMTNPELRPLRQLAATIAYRAAKVLRDVPPAFATFTCGESTRTPVRIVAHMSDLMTWGVSMAKGGYEWKPAGSDDWNREVDRFFDGLAQLDAALAAEPFTGSIEKLIQGPLADALTHVGQLALLRGMAGAPIKPESYARADIVVGRVGRDQSPPGREFEGDASIKK